MEAGFEISHDWTEHSAIGTWDSETTAKCGDEDYMGVTQSDITILINNDANRDSMAEFGVALASSHVCTCVLYPERRPSVFFGLADYVYDNAEALVQKLSSLYIKEAA